MSDDHIKTAMTVFNEAVETGCSMRDAVLSVYLRGRSDAGEPPIDSPKRAAVPPCDYKAVVTVYNELLCPPLPSVKSIDESRLNNDRRKKIRQMWEFVFTSKKSDGSKRASTHAEAVEWFRVYFERASRSDWIMGRDPRSGSWKGSLEYLMSTAGLRRVVEKTE